jgi:hypothetical protein
MMKFGRLAGVVLLAAVLVTIGAPLAGAASIPYSDPAVNGQITLCNSAHQPVTSGKVDAAPFVDLAVGSVAAPTGYQIAGRTASLYGYQPIKDVDPTLWPGMLLINASVYANAAYPTAAGTLIDRSLASFLRFYPTKWDGLIQLRLFVGAPGQAVMTTPYNSATIKVSGDTWSMVQGGTSHCNEANAISNARALPAYSKAVAAAAQASGAHASASPGRSGTASLGSSARPGDPDATSTDSFALAAGSAGGGGGTGPWVWIGLAVVVVAAWVCGLVWMRRRAGQVRATV